MRRHRGGPPPPSDDSSSDEEDAFSILSRKKKKSSRNTDTSSLPSAKKTATTRQDDETKGVVSNTTTSASGAVVPPPETTTKAETSSNKRHHFHNSAREAKMEALLLELQETATNPTPISDRPLPDKMGSFVMPGEEQFTTNIFVGNLAPITTEEELTEVFRQFGDLYSVKIMWPRTAEERSRGRNTGFVCFMNRDDAQEAMDAYQDSDPLRTGRRMVLRWGKNVKKSVKRGTGGVPIPPIRRKVKKSVGEALLPKEDKIGIHSGTAHDCIGQQPRKKGRRLNGDTNTDALYSDSTHNDTAPGFGTNTPKATAFTLSTDISNQTKGISVQQQPVIEIPIYDPATHQNNAIRVIPPSDPMRLKFITTVASFVAKDGSVLEKKIIERESNNPNFSFLMPPPHDNTLLHTVSISSLTPSSIQNQITTNERIFYRWRVFAFSQRDGFDSWRTDPFVMIQPHGRFWIPPSLDADAALREETKAVEREEHIRSQQEIRRQLSGKKDFMTGRQLEHAKFGGSKTAASDGAAELNDSEMAQWNDMIGNKLCASSEAICEAMSFCFDKSGAAKQISELLREALMDDRKGVSVETRIARLYLMSDILFNSQQPGVKNAFRYRDAIETLAPDVFRNFGQHGQGFAGRMTMNKLRNAVRLVLSAWASWSVYNVTFLDELQAKFEGKEWPPPPEIIDDIVHNDTDDESAQEIAEIKKPQETEFPEVNQCNDVEILKARWVEATDIEETCQETSVSDEGIGIDAPITEENIDGDFLGDEELNGETLDDDDLNGAALADDIDGEALDDSDLDGEALSDEEIAEQPWEKVRDDDNQKLH